MTINLATNGSSAMDFSKVQITGSSVSAQSSTSGTSELSEEEKLYDADGDGTLSITEKTAYLEAQSRSKSLESMRQSADTESAATVSISDEAMKLQKQGRPEGPPPYGGADARPDVSEMSDDELKSMLSDMKSKTGRLPKELSGYNDTDISKLSEDDLNSIRESMTQMQEKMSEQMSSQAGSEQQRLMSQVAAAYSQFK